VHGADDHILASLQRCGMHWDGEVTWQTKRYALYQHALEQLGDWSTLRLLAPRDRRFAGQPGHASQSGADLSGHLPQRPGAGQGRPRAAREGAAVAALRASFEDRWAGHYSQDLTAEVGDFIIRRADGYWAYQLAVVVDDGAQGITDIVRGVDLLDSTPRQLYLQQVLGLPQPSYLHVPVVLNEAGDKMSKQTGAIAFDDGSDPQQLLHKAMLPAARFLGLDLQADSIEAFWRAAIPAWAQLLQTLPRGLMACAAHRHFSLH
jgi:glutamyl-Q tRNA(Asp) synthetase